jgi:hypothetical protein
MKRILFWIFIAAFLVAFFWGTSASEHWPDAERMLFWTVVEDIVLAAMTGGIAWYIIYALKNGVVVLAGKYGDRAFSRDSEPFYYWSVMIFYGLVLILLIFALTGFLLKLFNVEITSQKIQTCFVLFFLGFASFLPFIFAIGGLRTGVVLAGKKYQRSVNPFAYWFFTLFWLFLGSCFIAFGIHFFFHPQV